MNYALVEVVGNIKNAAYNSGPFKNLCQTGKIKNTKGHRDEDRNRCRAICS